MDNPHANAYGLDIEELERLAGVGGNAASTRSLTEDPTYSDQALPYPEDPAVTDWPDPLSLTARVDPEPYPEDALSPRIYEAVKEVQGFVKAPVAMIVSSALTALSLACQGHVDVKRADLLQGPTSLNLLVIAGSGERKDTCDDLFMGEVRRYQDERSQDLALEVERPGQGRRLESRARRPIVGDQEHSQWEE